LRTKRYLKSTRKTPPCYYFTPYGVTLPQYPYLSVSTGVCQYIAVRPETSHRCGLRHHKLVPCLPPTDSEPLHNTSKYLETRSLSCKDWFEPKRVKVLLLGEYFGPILCVSGISLRKSLHSRSHPVPHSHPESRSHLEPHSHSFLLRVFVAVFVGSGAQANTPEQNAPRSCFATVFELGGREL